VVTPSAVSVSAVSVDWDGAARVGVVQGGAGVAQAGVVQAGVGVALASPDGVGVVQDGEDGVGVELDWDGADGVGVEQGGDGEDGVWVVSPSQGAMAAGDGCRRLGAGRASGSAEQAYVLANWLRLADVIAVAR